MTEGLIDDEKWSFRSEKGCINQVFTLRKIGESISEKKQVIIVCEDLGGKRMLGLIGKLFCRC